MDINISKNVMTKKINVFDQTHRKIKCIEKTHDYLGDGNPITEEELEVGKIYNYVGGAAESYGNMVFLEEVPSQYGYQSYLFEELNPYDESILIREQEHWLFSKLEKSEESIRDGRVVPAKEAFEKLRLRLK